MKEEPGQHLMRLEEISLDSDIQPISRIVPLFRTEDARVRSKLARLVGRYLGHKSFVDKRLEDEDARVRANAVESLLGLNPGLVRPLLHHASFDRNHRVRMNALLGLYMMGEPGVAQALIKQAASRSPVVRAAAAWAMGQTRSAEFQEMLTTLCSDEDFLVRNRALVASSSIPSPQSPPQE
jgi:HEAT repeat protein